MKKSSKAWLLIAIVMMVVGVGFASIGTAMGGRWGMIFDLENFKITTGSKNMISDKVSVDSSFKKIDINTSTVDVNIKKGTENSVEYRVPEYMKPEITTVGNTLSIITSKKNTFVLFDFNFGKTEDSYINITLTEDMYEKAMEIAYKTSTGDLTVEGININGVLETSTGDIKLTNVISDEIRIDGSTSDVTITNCTINGSLSTSLSTGEVVMKDTVVTEKYEAESSTGDIKITNSEITWFNMDGSTSDLTVKSSEMDRVEVTTSTGDIELEIKGNEQDYGIKLHTSTGDMDVCGREIDAKSYEGPAGTKQINIETSTGDITININ